MATDVSGSSDPCVVPPFFVIRKHPHAVPNLQAPSSTGVTGRCGGRTSDPCVRPWSSSWLLLSLSLSPARRPCGCRTPPPTSPPQPYHRLTTAPPSPHLLISPPLPKVGRGPWTKLTRHLHCRLWLARQVRAALPGRARRGPRVAHGAPDRLGVASAEARSQPRVERGRPLGRQGSS